ENRSRQPVLSRQPGLGVRAAGAPRSRRSAPDGGGGSAAEELGRPGSSGRPASEAASARRRDRGVAARARRRRRGDRPWQDREEDKRGTGAAEEMKAGGTRQKATASGWLAAFCLFPFAFCLFACTPKPPALPAGAPSPFPEYQQAWTEATRECAGVQTLTASLAMSGKVAKTTLRGRIDAGFAAPSSLRLEAVAPFGRPVFVLVATGDAGTLLLERDNRVLRGARPADIVEALAGVPLGAADLRAVVTGCGLWAAASPHEGRRYADGWAAVDLDDGTAFLRQANARWRMAAAASPHMTVRYGLDGDGAP